MQKFLYIFSFLVLITSCQLKKTDLEGHWTSVTESVQTNGIRSNGFLGGTIIFRDDSIFVYNSFDFLKIRNNYNLRNDSIIIESDPKLFYEIELNGNELKLSGRNQSLNSKLSESYVFNKHDYIIPNESELLRDTINIQELKNTHWLIKDSSEINLYYMANSKYHHIISEDSIDLAELPVKIDFNDQKISFSSALSFRFKKEDFFIDEMKHGTLFIKKVRNDTTWFAEYSGR